MILNLIINDTDYILHGILDTLLCGQKICPFLILVAVHFTVWKFMDISTQILRETKIKDFEAQICQKLISRKI